MHAKIDHERDQTEERKAREKTENRKARDKSEKRKEMHKCLDEERDKTPKRRRMHANIDAVRDKLPKRKEMHRQINKKNDAKESRKLYYKQQKDNPKYNEKLIKSFYSDTGFDLICSSCLEYKKREYCKSINTLSSESKGKYIVKYCSILKNRSEGQYVCNLCLKDIRNGKVPKRNKKSKFRFACFPSYMLSKLKKVDILPPTRNECENIENEKLNRLEAFLLKLVIPFLRVAHCPRGRYLKLKGDLILISSDIQHSLNKILPIDQGLIPVSFKRKLSYSGFYIEEFIDKEKVKSYFSWLKTYNHLFRNVNLNSELVAAFEENSLQASEDFEKMNSLFDEQDQFKGFDDNADTESVELTDDESETMEYDKFEPCLKDEVEFSHNKTTLFLDKYCENPDVPSIACRLAEVIVEYEIHNSIEIYERDDEEIDDEILSEEEFLKQVDDENDQDNCLLKENKHKEVQDEISDDIDVLIDPPENTSESLSSEATKHAKAAVKKMEKICVAPGEAGKFKNWGEDIFLEEKAFPEKFPYGVGGYLSSMLNSEREDMGFAAYCINQIMSCDPKFREDSTYVFFLLLVKELIHMKRCRSTFMRQATRLPNLSKTDILNADPLNLNRYNRSYQVYKNMRGTAMYYEEAKKHLMAMFRQLGCPTIFLTLSCAEFDWIDLLKEIVETVERRKVTTEYVESLPSNVKNKLISDNVVISTVHFQKRMDKLFTLMKNNFFKDRNTSYFVDAFFFRVEFQQRGAPHIHSLLWMKTKDGKDAPSFWFTPDSDTCNEDEDEKKKSSNKID